MKSLLSICVDNLHQVPIKDLEPLKEYLLPRRISKMIHSLEIYNRFKTCSQFITKYKVNRKEDILVSGSIQSGKTNEMLFYCWWSIFICQRKVIFVCRNIKADKLQLLERISIFNQKFIQNKRFFIKETKPSSKRRGLICIIANHIQTKRIYETIQGDYNLCIDEADTCVKSRVKDEFRFQEYFKFIERNSKHQIGATATEFAVISAKKTLTRVLKMVEPSNYYGINDIETEFLPKLTPHNKPNDPNLTYVYDKLFQKSSFVISSFYRKV